MYVVLDGFDLGVGALHLFLARNEEEREEATAAIGPVWNGNEVWLLASGGVLFMAFPKAYAGAFSGLYFGLIIVLWLLVGRGLGLEFRHQLESPLWRGACDAVFCLSSAALALVFGVALGNVVRGVPLGADGYFSLPLFNILNWYALLVGVFGLRRAGRPRRRLPRLPRNRGSRRCAHGAGRADSGSPRPSLFVALIGPTYAVRDEMLQNLIDHPWRLVFPLLVVASLAGMFIFQRAGTGHAPSAASSLFIVGLLTTMAAGLYPNLLPAREGDPHSLTVDNAAAGSHTLKAALIWWPIGMALAAVYFVFAYRMFFRSAAKPQLGTD